MTAERFANTRQDDGAAHVPFAILSSLRCNGAQYVPGRKRGNRSMKRASLPIRMRGSFLSMPLMMRNAASLGVVLAAFSNRSIDCYRRALSVTPIPVRELRAMAVATPPGCTTDSLTGLPAMASSCRTLSEKPRTANFAAA